VKSTAFAISLRRSKIVMERGATKLPISDKNEVSQDVPSLKKLLDL